MHDDPSSGKVFRENPMNGRKRYPKNGRIWPIVFKTVFKALPLTSENGENTCFDMDLRLARETGLETAPDACYNSHSKRAEGRRRM